MDESLDVMSFFWRRFSAADKEGRKSLVFKDRAELELLYKAGFVERSHAVEDWLGAFETHLQKDGSYLLNEKEWEEKRRFIPTLKNPKPFDPMELREGVWDVKEFDRMVEEEILPSTLVDAEDFRKQTRPLHDKALVSGRITVTKQLKTALKSFLDQFPSPLRLLQLQFAASKPSQGPASGFAKGRSESQAAINQLNRLLGRN